MPIIPSPDRRRDAAPQRPPRAPLETHSEATGQLVQVSHPRGMTLAQYVVRRDHLLGSDLTADQLFTVADDIEAHHTREDSHHRACPPQRCTGAAISLYRNAAWRKRLGGLG